MEEPWSREGNGEPIVQISSPPAQGVRERSGDQAELTKRPWNRTVHFPQNIVSCNQNNTEHGVGGEREGDKEGNVDWDCTDYGWRFSRRR